MRYCVLIGYLQFPHVDIRALGVGNAQSVERRAGQQEFESRQGQDFFFTTSRQALGLTQPPIQ
jgi:hypothetical protein